MKGMSFEKRISHYNTYLKYDTLKRLKEYLKSNVDELENTDFIRENSNLFTSSQNQFQNKINIYTEIIELLVEYEFETILLILYFEELNVQLFNVLGEKLTKNKPIYFQDKFLILNSFEKGFEITKIVLTEKLNLTNIDWIEKKSMGNPIEKKLTEWIGLKIIESNTESEIKLVLFHFTKYWKTKYSNPYNETKGVVLLNDLILILKKNLHCLKIDFKKILAELYDIFDSLIFSFNLPPFLENEFSLRQSKIQGYKLRKDEFNLLLAESCKYLVNYEKLSNLELYEKYFTSDNSIQKLIFKIIEGRFSNNYIPDRYEIDYFNNNYLPLENDSLKLIEHFIRVNYLF
jgi:hypothetical protein